MKKDANKTKIKDKNVFSKSKSRKKIILFFLAVFFVLIFIFLLPGQSKIYKEPNLVAFFKFDGKEGCEIFDNSGNNHSGALKSACPENSPLWIEEGKDRGALKFDGIDDYVDVLESDFLNITDKITVDLWIKYSADPKSFNGVILTKYSENLDMPYSIYSNRDIGIRFIIRDKYGREFSALFPQKDLKDWQNTWFNVVGNFDGKNLRIKINGKEGQSVKANTEIRTSHDVLRIGALGLNDLPFKGIIDEVKIYNK